MERQQANVNRAPSTAPDEGRREPRRSPGRDRRLDSLLESKSGPRAGALRSALALTTVIFAIDLWLPAGLTLGSLYILPVLMSVWTARRRVTLGVAGLCTLLTPIGAQVALLSGPGAVGFDAALLEVARSLTGLVGSEPGRQLILLNMLHVSSAIFVIWVTTGLGLMRIELERELLESRELTSIALKSSADGVLTTDADDRISFLNKVAEELTGWDLEAARGRPSSDVFRLEPDPETADPAKLRRPRPGKSDTGRHLLVARDGHRQPVELSSAPIVDPEQELSGRVIVFRDASDLEAYETRLRDLAFRDRLTGLPNRTSLLERLDLELAHARRDGERLAMLFLDLDHFKQINDTFGHHAGDELLRAVSQRLLGCLREADTVARLGGDEFTVLIPGAQTARDVESVAKKIVETLARPVVLEGQLVPIQPSIGIALFPDHADSGDSLMRAADSAMYRAKKAGGARWALIAPERPMSPAARETQAESAEANLADDGRDVVPRAPSESPFGSAIHDRQRPR